MPAERANCCTSTATLQSLRHDAQSLVLIVLDCENVSYSLNSLNYSGLYGGLYRGPFERVLRGILGVYTIAHVSAAGLLGWTTFSPAEIISLNLPR